jgi:hypothetical protein
MDRRTVVALPAALPVVAGLAGLVSPAAAQRLVARSAVPVPTATITVRATVVEAPQHGKPVQVMEMEPPPGARWFEARTRGWVDGYVAVQRGRVRLTLVYL